MPLERLGDPHTPVTSTPYIINIDYAVVFVK